jgi:diacylglycerol kinase (ATP)
VAAPYFVVNPAAGGGRTRRLWPRLLRRLDQPAYVLTRVAGEATSLARAAVLAGHDPIVAVGGDGTLNEVLNGIIDADGRTLARLGAVMTGRGRDAGRNLGLSQAPATALEAALHGREVRVDVGKVEWPDGQFRFFLSATGAGFDAIVAARAAALAGCGRLAYFLAAVATIRACPTAPGRVRRDGAVWLEGVLTAVVVANGAWYGGGLKIAPMARVSDGALDVVAISRLGRLELLRWLPTLFWGGHLRNPKVRTATARVVTVEADGLPVHVDGEVCGATPVRIEVAPETLRLQR